MADRKLTVQIIGDESDLLRAFRTSTRASQRFSASFGTFFKGAVIFEGVRAGLDAIGSAARAGASEFSEQAKVLAQTNAVLKSTGGVANVTARDVQVLADRIRNLSGIDDEAIASAENLILTFRNVRNELGAGNQVFDRATQAAVDLSVAGFGSLDSTAKQLGKALQDPVRGMTALRRAGVTFSEQQQETIKQLVETNRTLDAQKLILREVETQVGGSAKAFGDTLPGQLAKVREAFRNAFGNLVEIVAQPLARALGAFAEFIPKIEEGVARISTAVGPALNDLVDAFTTRLPELQRIAISILDPLREHVFPILQDFAATVERMWGRIVEVFDQNSGSLRTILDNLGTVLANVWTVARPTIVFLFEKALPAALNIAIPILEKLTGITKVMSEVFVRSVRVIISVLDTFLGALSTLTDVASRLPFIGDQFAGISDKVNEARGGLRQFGADLDALDGRTVTVNIAVDVTTGRREEGALGRRNTGSTKDAADQVADDLDATGAATGRIETSARKATSAAKKAKTAAERQREAFERLMDALSLDLERAQTTKSFKDDLAALRQQEAAIRERIAVVGRTTELERQLLQIEQQRGEIQRQQVEQRRDARKASQFKLLGLTATGEERVPGIEALTKRLQSLKAQVKGTFLDTDKTRAQFAGIAKVLAQGPKAVGREMRAAILEMFNQISSAFKDGEKGSSGEITRGGIRSTQRLLRGLTGLSEEERRLIQQRNLGVSGRRGISAFGFAVEGAPRGFGGAVGAGVGGGAIVIQNLTVVTNDPNDLMKKLQKKARRSSGGRRGRHGGANLGMQ